LVTTVKIRTEIVYKNAGFVLEYVLMSFGSLLTYFKEVRIEMDKVTWPSREQTIRLTLIVILISILVATFIGALDWVLTVLLDLII